MSNWQLISLGDIADIEGGSTPRREIPEYWNGELPWVTPTDLPMSGDGIATVSNTREKITAKGLDSISAKLLPPGTVLFSSRATIGKLGISAVPLVTNQGFTNFKPKRDIDARFLAYSLWHFTPQISQLAGSTTFREVTKGNLRQFKIPLPPLSEQVRIVKLLDETDALRKLRAQADARTADLIPALFNEMFGDPATNPKGWSVTTINDAGAVLLGRQRAPQYQTGKYSKPYVRVANVFEDRIDLTDLLSMDFDESDCKRYSLRCGDILLNEGQSTELVGRPAMWRDEIPNCCFQNTLVRFRTKDEIVTPEYALALFLNYFRSGRFAAISSKTSNVAHLVVRSQSLLT
ncbi:MAG: restriction endonuclease subunit S [Chloroflexi bacterium]|nr:restriction endonuclease subunit S [Chloroflexota bacterium]